MKLRYAFKRTIANKSAGADKELKPEVPDGTAEVNAMPARPLYL